MLIRSLIGAGIAVHALPAAAPLAHPLARALGIQIRLDHQAGVALTFDDGPHPEGTPAVLELLAEARAAATFFLVGEQVQRRPRLAAEIVAAGHEVGLHCQRHRNLLRLTPRQIHDDLQRAVATIHEATERIPRLYRPPYGIFTGAGIVIARRHRWRPILWSRWGRDWEPNATPRSIAARVTKDVRGGDVLLLHDADYYSSDGSWRRTVAALPRVLAELQGRDLASVAIN
jgi:peptidoglycan-N-acetylglucosamine deacetylase